MKNVLILSAALLAACQPADTDNDLPLEDEAVDIATFDPGTVSVVLQDPISEAAACIVPIRIENGLDAAVSVTLIGFTVTGPGDDATGNMFAPAAAAGEASEARVILEGQSCDAFDTLSVPEVLCKAADADCSADVTLEDGGGLSFVQTG